MAEQPGERGYDAGKKINGRKRHLLVDTLGLILAVVVHSAGVQDREGAKLLLPALLNFGWVRIIFADAGYAGELLHWVADLIPGRGLTLQIIKRTVSGFKILPKRWVVERTFAWLGPLSAVWPKIMNAKLKIPKPPFTLPPATSCFAKLAK